MLMVVVQHGKRKLFEIIATGNTARRFPYALHGREQQGQKNSNDGNHEQRLHERERAPTATVASSCFQINHFVGNIHGNCSLLFRC